ncbi:MAG: FAD binding domain-containing protein [Syntrophorhabdaceae bacterium]|nr:FAD binding domain-containing protein [Syntrophorhabdaceae bacterium]
MLDGSEYYKPDRMADVHDLLERFGEKAAILAGGTDLVISIRQGEKKPEAIIDISGLPELHLLEVKDDGLHIGSMVTFAVLAASDAAREYAPALKAAVSEIGSPQIRNTGTIGGNIATASPAGDSLPALVAHDALVVLSAKAWERTLPVQDFLKERNGKPVGKEIITKVIVPSAAGTVKGSFVKLGRRNALAIARINVAAVIRRSPEGVIEKTRVVLGTLGKGPVRVSEAETLISRDMLTEDVKERIAQCAAEAVRNSIPGRSTMQYKARAVKGVVYALLERITDG